LTDKTAAHESKGQAEDFPWETWERVESLLRGEDWSPPPPAEQISAGLAVGGAGAACESRSGSTSVSSPAFPSVRKNLLGMSRLTSNPRCTLVFLLPCDSPPGSIESTETIRIPSTATSRPSSRWPWQLRAGVRLQRLEEEADCAPDPGC